MTTTDWMYFISGMAGMIALSLIISGTRDLIKYSKDCFDCWIEKEINERFSFAESKIMKAVSEYNHTFLHSTHTEFNDIKYDLAKIEAQITTLKRRKR